MLTSDVRGSATRFRPGDRIAGSVEWLAGAPPESVELRLFWYTQGEGAQDVNEVHNQRFPSPGQQDSREFSFEFPLSPYSFSGKLISLLWALELVVKPTGEVERLDLTMSPTGEEIRLLK